MARRGTQGGFEVVWPKEDVKALHAGMQRARKELKAGIGGAMRMAGFKLSETMGTSTRVSDKKRDYKILQKQRAVGDKPKSMLIRVVSYRGGKRKVFIKRVEGGIREANASKYVRVGMSGLAKSSWRWAANAARTSRAVGLGGLARSAKEWGRKYGGGDSRLRGDDPFYKINSTLPYIEQAMIPGAANDALRRAASGLEKWIDKELDRRMKKAVGK